MLDYNTIAFNQLITCILFKVSIRYHYHFIISLIFYHFSQFSRFFTFFVLFAPIIALYLNHLNHSMLSYIINHLINLSYHLNQKINQTHFFIIYLLFIV